MQSLTLQRSDPFTRNRLLRDGISQAIYEAMKEDPSIYLFGEGCVPKQHYDAPYILKDFPERIVTMPICEDGSMNYAVGASLLGVKPVVDLIGSDFLYRAMDSIANTAAKLDFVTRLGHTIVIRSECLTGGPTSGQRPEVLFTHIPGLRVVMPSTPRDAYGLMKTALAMPGVTLVFEDRMIQDGEFSPEDMEFKGPVPFGVSSWRVKGQRGNVTIVTYGIMRQRVERLLGQYSFDGDRYAEEYNMLCDLIDLRSLYPIDWANISKMLERTGRLLVIEPDVQYGGIGAEIAATISERMPHVRVKRLGAPRTTIPASMALHDRMLPSEEEVRRAITEW